MNNYTGYDGNRLTAISGFINSGYQYDVNGNQKINTAKGITNIDYNYLNLPVSVTGPNVSYTYDATGKKLRKQSAAGTVDYLDGIQYKSNGQIDFIQTEEGVARNNTGTYSYEYNLSDHLGNVRATFYQNPNSHLLEVIQRDDYYAFGLRKMGLPNSNTNKYLYNGKELQEELGEFDYGARFYDPEIARWNVVDPLAEQMRRYSPYNYGFNNPIRFIDPDGMEPIERDENGNIKYQKAEKQNYDEQVSYASFSDADKNIYSIKTNYEVGTIKTDLGHDVSVDKAISSFLTINGGEEIDISDPKVAAKYGLDPSSNCYGLALADGKFSMGANEAQVILNDEFTLVGTDKGMGPSSKNFDHNVVAIGSEASISDRPNHVAIKEDKNSTYTHKNDVGGVKTNQSLNKVVNYNNQANPTVDGRPASEAVRAYYKRK